MPHAFLSDKDDTSRKVLCLDVGYANMGCAVWDCETDRFVHLCCISTDKGEQEKVSDQDIERVQFLTKGLSEIGKRFAPALVLAECPHGGAKSARAIKSMALATATVSAYCGMKTLLLKVVRPMEIKRLVSKGEVSKEEVLRLATDEFGDIFPRRKNGSWAAHAEHLADACCTILVARKKWPQQLLP